MHRGHESESGGDQRTARYLNRGKSTMSAPYTLYVDGAVRRNSCCSVVRPCMAPYTELAWMAADAVTVRL